MDFILNDAELIKTLALEKWRRLTFQDNPPVEFINSKLFECFPNHCSFCGVFKDLNNPDKLTCCTTCPLRVPGSIRPTTGCCGGLCAKWHDEKTVKNAQAVYDYINGVSVEEIKEALIKLKL